MAAETMFVVEPVASKNEALHALEELSRSMIACSVPPLPAACEVESLGALDVYFAQRSEFEKVMSEEHRHLLAAFMP